MRAGQLREPVVFQKETKTTSESGAKKTVYVDYLTTRCSKRKLSAVTGSMNVSEEFIGNTAIIQVRYNPLISDTDRVLYNGKTFSIRLLDKQLADNTYLITLSKANL